MDQVHNFVGKFDFFRASCLKHALRIHFFRGIYTKCSTRLIVGYILTLLFYLPVSILRPDVLLLSGPLIFGYPHLIASFRYVQKMSIGLFALLTLICILGHLGGFKLSLLHKLPFGVWQIVVAMTGLLISNYIERSFTYVQIIFALLFCSSLIYFAHTEAIIFTGGMLILHNWIGYFYWIIASQKKSRKSAAIFALVIFAIIHLLVLQGILDNFFPIFFDQIKFPGETRATGWYLASWTNEAVVWYRFLVLYAFGLSMHYFVWLKAIPQSLNQSEHPNNMRLSFKYLREDLGAKFLLIIGLISIIGISIWLFSFKIGARIYFEIAILHGALELVFLLPKILKSCCRTQK